MRFAFPARSNVTNTRLALSGWDFFTSSDPTNGLVNFQSEANATSKGLAYVQDDDTVVIAVDHSTTLPSGTNRDS